MVGSMYWKTDRQKRKEYEGIVKERKAKEKNAAWIKELEARDQEEKEIRAYRQALTEGKKLGQMGVKKAVEDMEAKKAELEKKVEADVKAVEEQILEQDAEQGASATVEKEKRQKGVFESVQELVWPSKK